MWPEADEESRPTAASFEPSLDDVIADHGRDEPMDVSTVHVFPPLLERQMLPGLATVVPSTATSFEPSFDDVIATQDLLNATSCHVLPLLLETQIVPLPEVAASFDPSLEDAMEVQNWLEAGVDFAHITPPSLETQISLAKVPSFSTTASIEPSLEDATEFS